MRLYISEQQIEIHCRRYIKRRTLWRHFKIDVQIGTVDNGSVGVVEAP